MTTATEIFKDAFTRVHDELPTALGGLKPATVFWRPDPDANSIGWLAWHLTRVQDDHLAGVGQVEQVWTSEGFFERFGLPYPVAAHGYGQTSAEVGQFDIGDVTTLLAYHEAVHRMTIEVLDSLDDEGYSRIVDERWDPPVTAAVRLVSVIGDLGAHLGQIEYIRGMAERRA